MTQKIYTAEDIPLVTDTIAWIRQHPELYAGPPPYRRRLAARLVHDLVCFGLNNVSAEAFDTWWLVTAQMDWLVIDGIYRAEYWRTVRAAPEIGLDACRPEVVMTALSHTLFTVANGSVEFVVGNEIGHDGLRTKVKSLAAPDFRGRAVGFLIEE
ncbi:MAG TPA: hypothetical protein VHE77_13445 [Dongiaceae bacterium]|jgi:hypothetical protein|nr:hypothetical protein [Dongiaceae bacterium]